MKRDWEIVRGILIRLEELKIDEGPLQLKNFPLEKANEYSYNVELLIESGLIKGEMSKTIGVTPKPFLIYRLTWNGHDLLDTIKNPDLWDKIKQYFRDNGLPMTIEFIKEAAKKFI